MTIPEENERLYRRLIDEVWNQGRFDVIDELVADDCIYYDATTPEPLRGPEGMREFAETWTQVLDGEVELEQVLTTNDWVVARFTARGTHVGEAMGIEPTNEAVEVRGIEIVRFEGGQIVEGYQVFDALGFLQQIDALSADLATGAPAAD